MTTHDRPNEPNSHEPRDGDVDAAFAELIASMPELASPTPVENDAGLEDVTLTIPNPANVSQPLRLVVQVPAAIAPALRAEFTPERITTMMQTLTAMAALAMPPPQA